MKNKKWFLLLSALALLIILIIALIPGNNQNAQKPSQGAEPLASAALMEKPQETPAPAQQDGRYIATEGYVRYNAEISKPDTLSVPLPKARLFNCESAGAEIMTMLDPAYPDGWKLLENGYQGRQYGWKRKNGISFSLSPTAFSFEYDFGTNIEFMCLSSYKKIYFYPEYDFSWGTREAAAGACLAYLEKTGLSFQANKVYAISKAMYEEEYQKEAANFDMYRELGMERWIYDHIDGDDEMLYYIFFNQTVEGIPINLFDCHSTTKLEYISAPRIIGVVNKSGVQLLDTNNLYQIIPTDSYAAIISFEAAVSAFNHYMNDILIQSNEQEVVSIGLEYRADRALNQNGDTANLHPYWIFLLKGCGSNNLIEVIREIPIDAVTGQVIF